MAKYQLLLPKMGESVAEATVIKWIKNPGDYIEVDEAVMEIATDKVDSEVPSPVSGKLIEQLYKEDDVVQVGSAIAIIETEPDKTEHPAADSRPTIIKESAPEPVAYKAAVAQPVKVQEPAATPVNLPEPADQEIPGIGQLIEKTAYAKSGTKYDNRFYSPLVKSIATQEHISNEELDYIPGTGADGRLTKDDLLEYIQNRAGKPAFKTPNLAGTEVRTSITQEKSAQNGSKSPVATAPVDSKPVTPSSPQPAAGSIASQEYVGESSQQPTADAAKTAQATEAPKSAPKPAASVSGGEEVIEMDRMRRLIADHMVYSKHTSPHVTSFVEADVTELVAWREKVKGPFEKREGQKLTFTPIFIEAVVKAIIAMPMINVSVSGSQIIKKKNINISMATALPNGNLIVPVIKNADNLSLLGITKSVNDLANRARIGKLVPDDVKDGTFTITNVGSFGNIMGTPIINQPQVAILAVGAIKKKPAVIETPHGDAIAIRHMMFLSLSYDHRVVDGALGGTFVRKVADYLENWDISRNI